MDTLDSGGDPARAYRLYSTAKGKATLPARKTGYLLGKSVAAGGRLSARGAGRVLGGARTVGKQVEMRYRLSRIDSGKVDSLSDTDQKRLGELLKRYGRDGQRLSVRLDRENLAEVLSWGCGGSGVFASGGSVAKFATAPRDLCEDSLGENLIKRELVTSDADIDENAVVAKLDALDGNERNRLGLAVARHEDGLELVEDVSLVRLLDRSEMDDAISLHRDGVPASRIQELIDADADLEFQARMVTELKNLDEQAPKPSNPDDIAEVVGQNELKKIYPEQDYEHITSRDWILDAENKNDNKMEVDNIIIEKSSGNLVAFGQTKNSPSLASDANSQIKKNVGVIRNGRLVGIEGGEHNYRYPNSDLDLLDRTFTIGSSNEYSVEIPDKEMIDELWRTYDSHIK